MVDARPAQGFDMSWLLQSFAVATGFVLFTATADGADRCLVKSSPFEVIVFQAALFDWYRDFALDRLSPSTKPTIANVARWVVARADLGDAKSQWLVAESIIRTRGPDGCG